MQLPVKPSTSRQSQSPSKSIRDADLVSPREGAAEHNHGDADRNGNVAIPPLMCAHICSPWRFSRSQSHSSYCLHSWVHLSFATVQASASTFKRAPADRNRLGSRRQVQAPGPRRPGRADQRYAGRGRWRDVTDRSLAAAVRLYCHIYPIHPVKLYSQTLAPRASRTGPNEGKHVHGSRSEPTIIPEALRHAVLLGKHCTSRQPGPASIRWLAPPLAMFPKRFFTTRSSVRCASSPT